jgi:hypothetical protein
VVSRVTIGFAILAAAVLVFGACPDATLLKGNPINIAAKVNPFLLSMLEASCCLLPAHCIRSWNQKHQVPPLPTM